MAAAQRLATASAIDLAVARAHDPAARRRVSPEQRRIEIGPRGRRGLKTYVQLFAVIAAGNDVVVDVARDSTYVLAYGFSDDIDVTSALYASLVVQMVASSDAYIASGDYRGETALRVVTRTEGRWRRREVEEAPVAPITARLNFQTAFAQRIGLRLTQARDDARAAAVAERPAASTEVALRHKEVEVRDFHTAQSSARGTWRPTSASAGYSEAARRAGDRAGRRAKLRPDERLGGARGRLRGGREESA